MSILPFHRRNTTPAATRPQPAGQVHTVHVGDLWTVAQLGRDSNRHLVEVGHTGNLSRNGAEEFARQLNSRRDGWRYEARRIAGSVHMEAAA